MMKMADSLKNGSHSFMKMWHSSKKHEYGAFFNESAIVEYESCTIYVADSCFRRADSYLRLSYSESIDE
jgi:hypothetical protein